MQTAVHRVPSCGDHAVLLGVRAPVRVEGGGRTYGDPRSECIQIVGV